MLQRQAWLSPPLSATNANERALPGSSPPDRSSRSCVSPSPPESSTVSWRTQTPLDAAPTCDAGVPAILRPQDAKRNQCAPQNTCNGLHDNRETLRCATLIFKRLLLAVVAGALLLDIFLVRKAHVLGSGGDASAKPLAAPTLTRTSTAPRSQSLDPPRYPLPLTNAQNALTNGRSSASRLPAETGASRRDGLGWLTVNVAESAVPEKVSEVPAGGRGSGVQGSVMNNTSLDKGPEPPHVGHDDAIVYQAVSGPAHARAMSFFAGDETPVPTPSPLLPPPAPDPFDGQRVAIVVPYVGRELPVWWDAFVDQAKHNEGLLDWIIFCDKVFCVLCLGVTCWQRVISGDGRTVRKLATCRQLDVSSVVDPRDYCSQQSTEGQR